MGLMFLLAFTWVVVTGFARPSDTTLALFSDVYAVPITDENRGLVERYIRASRAMRMTGVVVAVAALIAIRLLTDAAANIMFILGAGYGLGAVAFELFRRPPGAGGATLSRRRLDDYVRPAINRLLYVSASFGVLVFAVAMVLPTAPSRLTSVALDGYPAAGGVALAALCLTLLVGRRIITAPQPVISPPIDAAQHAVRSCGLVSLVGLALMAASVLALGGAELSQRDSPDWLATTTLWVGLPLAILSSTTGFFLAVRSLPRFAPFWRKLPDIEPARA